MTGRRLIDYILDNNLEDYEFYFNAADDHSMILPLDEQFINIGFNDEIDGEYHSDMKNPPEIVLFEAT